jgi:hypothetical protein
MLKFINSDWYFECNFLSMYGGMICVISFGDGIRLLIHKEGDLHGNEWKNEYMFNDGKGYKSSNQGKGIPGRIGQ